MALLSLVPVPRHSTDDATVRSTSVQSTPVHDARDLTGPGGEARLLLDGQTYTLRVTRAGKLILTK